MLRLVTISTPEQAGTTICEVVVNARTPYEAVKAASTAQERTKTIIDTFGMRKIAELLPIHNATGIRDTQQVKTMSTKLDQSHIYQGDGLPNIKIVIAPDGRLLAFDGHHSLLAYLQKNFTYLSQIPYLIISKVGHEPLDVVELTTFFPKDARNKIIQSWSGYTVNWQASNEAQLETRSVESLFELFDELSERDKGASKK